MKEIIPVVAACIIKRDPTTRILLHRKDESRNPELIGKWEFPGGMMEYGETPEQTLRREIGEELGGIIITVFGLLHAQTNIYKDGVHYLVLFYRCHTSYDPAPDGCEYFRRQDLVGLDCLPGTAEVIRKIFTDRRIV